MKISLLPVLALLAFAGFTQRGDAQLNTWINPENGSWYDSSNWSRGTIPTGSTLYTAPTSIKIDEGSSFISSGNAEAGTMHIGTLENLEGRLRISGSSSQLTQTGGLYLGIKGGTGRLTIQNGGTLNADLASSGYIVGWGIGNATSRSYGIATVTGYHSSWNILEGLEIGSNLSNSINKGTGTLNVSDGGTVNSGGIGLGSGVGSEGNLTINQTGSSVNSQSLSVATSGGTATVSILGGGALNISTNPYLEDSFVGYEPGSNGTVYVDGTGSQLNHASVLVLGKYGGTGSLLIGSGATADIQTLKVGDHGWWPDSGSFISSHGTVDVNGGTLKAGSLLIQRGNGYGTVNLSNGGTVNVGNGAGAIDLGESGTLNIGNGVTGGMVQAGTITGGGNVNLNNPGGIAIDAQFTGIVKINQLHTGTSILTGNNTTSGQITISAGVLQIGAGGNSGALGSGNVIDNASLVINRAGTVALTNNISGTGSLEKRGSGTVIIAAGSFTGWDAPNEGYNTYTGGTLITEGTLQIGNGGNSGYIVGNVINNASLAFNKSNSEMDFSGDISGSGHVTKLGGGVLAFGGNNTYSGGTTITSGTLRIGGGYAGTGNISGNIENNSHLEFRNTNDLIYNGIISGSGDVTKNSYSTLTLGNFNNYTGATFLNAGTLTVEGGIMGNGGLVTVAAGATLNGTGTVNRDVLVNSNGNLASSLIITGQVTLSNQQSVGAVVSETITANNGQQLVVTTATGGNVNAAAGTASIETLNGATLTTGNWGASVVNLASGTVQTSGGSLVAQQGDFTGTISGSGGLTKTGAGILTLNNANSYTGATIVRDGTLEVAVSGAIGSTAPVQLENDGILRVNSSVAITGNVVTTSADAKYVKEFGAGEALSNYGSFQSNLSGSETTASIAQGTATVGNQEVTMQFSNNGGFGSNASDRLSITGLNGTAFLLVMDVNMNIPVNPDLDYFFLGWFDPADGALKNAVDGNVGIGALAGGYRMSYESFLLNNGGWNSGAMLGAYGADADTDQVWAVINHNSEFAVAPEPSTCGLFLLATATLVIRRRRK